MYRKIGLRARTLPVRATVLYYRRSGRWAFFSVLDGRQPLARVSNLRGGQRLKDRRWQGIFWKKWTHLLEKVDPLFRKDTLRTSVRQQLYVDVIRTAKIVASNMRSPISLLLELLE